MSGIEFALWLSGCVVGTVTTLIATHTRKRLSTLRAEVKKLERANNAALAGPPREVVLGYAVRRDGADLVLEWKSDGAVREQYYMTDVAAAQLVCAIVAKFEA